MKERSPGGVNAGPAVDTHDAVSGRYYDIVGLQWSERSRGSLESQEIPINSGRGILTHETEKIIKPCAAPKSKGQSAVVLGLRGRISRCLLGAQRQSRCNNFHQDRKSTRL